MTGLAKYDAACARWPRPWRSTRYCRSGARPRRCAPMLARPRIAISRSRRHGSAFRAERRLGEMMHRATGNGRIKRWIPRPIRGKTTLAVPIRNSADDRRRRRCAEAGIDRKLSSRAQKMAAMDADRIRAAARAARAPKCARATTGSRWICSRPRAEADGRAHRRNLAQTLSSNRSELPSGRRFPAMYLDPPWRRKGGIGNRAYENHYPTMPGRRSWRYLRRPRDTPVA